MRKGRLSCCSSTVKKTNKQKLSRLSWFFFLLVSFIIIHHCCCCCCCCHRARPVVAEGVVDTIFARLQEMIRRHARLWACWSSMFICCSAAHTSLLSYRPHRTSHFCNLPLPPRLPAILILPMLAMHRSSDL